MPPVQPPLRPPVGHDVGQITLRYWAAARHAAGVESDLVAASEPISLAALHQHAVTLHPERLPRVLAVCAALIDDRPVGTADPSEVLVAPGSTVEFLPPFAGG